MKKLILSLFLGFSTILLSSSFSVNQEEKSLKAYISVENTWCEGSISYIPMQNGYKLTRYSFNASGRNIEGHFNGGEKFVQLNSNNNLAKSYNFTYYVDFIESSGRKGYRAYIINN